MLSFAKIPTPFVHFVYRPKSSSAMDDAETAILLMACTGYYQPQILEIGTWIGETTNNIATVIRPHGGMVTTLDVKGHEHIGEAVTEEMKPYVRFATVEEGKHECDEVRDRKYHVVFVDGDHSYEGVMLDTYLAKSVLADDGVILYHDVWWDVVPPPADGPLRFFRDVGGIVLNLTHLGVLPEHLNRLRGMIW
ncbi:MAG: class I SAM-dependent methyltransferase [Candidatus Paceibacterota bacterium]|jgi:predicted O-methyltransferase YrrM